MSEHASRVFKSQVQGLKMVLPGFIILSFLIGLLEFTGIFEMIAVWWSGVDKYTQEVYLVLGIVLSFALLFWSMKGLNFESEKV